MTLTEAQREMETGRFTLDGLKWIVLHMACDSPDRFAEATAALREHVVTYPECRSRFTVPAPVENGVRCCNTSVCSCNTARCNCKCAGCMCDF